MNIDGLMLPRQNFANKKIPQRIAKAAAVYETADGQKIYMRMST